MSGMPSRPDFHSWLARGVRLAVIGGAVILGARTGFA
jgi:hypothetical protein